MNDGADKVLEFRAAIETNRQIFSLQYPYAYFAFFGVCEMLEAVARRLETGRNANGKTLVSLLPFAMLVSRQAMSAFEALSSFRSYEAWVLLRPAIEATLIMGKWVDDPANADIWSNRHTRKTEYVRTYTGKWIVSDSLPRAAELRAVMDKINDEYVHANEPYYAKHLNATALADERILVRLEFFDERLDAEPNALAFLHLVAVVADSLDEMLAMTLPTTGPHRPGLPKLRSALSPHVASCRAQGRSTHILSEYGLWPDVES
jgi:hypothetical protein